MRIIPVVDLKAGRVVRGIAGRREEYQPIVSRLTPSSLPVEVAQALRDQFRFTEIYVADLDAIVGGPPAFQTYAALRSLGFRLWVDAGVRDLGAIQPLVQARIERIVVGLETVAGPAALAGICHQIGTEKVVFSLDLKESLPLGDQSQWQQADAWSIATQAIAAGLRSIIVLDLAQVGVYGGTGTEDLCRRLASAYPEVEVVAGGGIRNAADLQRLRQCGVRAALVASALHDGRLRPEDLTGS